VRREIHELLAVEFFIEFGDHYKRRILELLRQTRKSGNLYIAHLMSVLGCKLNSLELHDEAEKLHRRALCIGAGTGSLVLVIVTQG